ncbi:MAG: HAD family hydrolase [Chitinophagaceae bacterium]|nr:HAD family hydrolase [Chitinophagaceae bacterium]
MKKDFSGMPVIKAALLGDSATQWLHEALRGCAYAYGIDLQIWEADYNQQERQLMDPGSELYRQQPQIILLFRSTQALLHRFDTMPANERATMADRELELIRSMANAVQSFSSARLICYNYAEMDDAVFGNYANRTPSSFLFQLRKLNFSLMQLSAALKDLFICDLNIVQQSLGREQFFRPAIYVNTEMTVSLEALPAVAERTLAIVRALQGQSHKCLVLDLDNTLWGGIIGDDGLENIQLGNLGIGKAFVAFQHWIKKLKERGIILAVCSKNSPEIAQEVFEKHPEMVLRLDDFAVFAVNWENKADNLRHIQSILNIGFDSMVFLDDNPFEREMVRTHVPGITVPELPGDPAEYLEYLQGMNLFETISVSAEDADRNKLYQAEALRKSTIQKFTNEDDYLQSLLMQSRVEPFNNYNTPRVAQLTQRSNQFNLRTVRYTEADIERIASSQQHAGFCFTLEDTFGSHGLIAVVILVKEDPATLFIDTWLMSCRVLKRGMEQFTLNTLAAFAKKHGFRKLKGEYRPTAKNGLVKDHYEALGFTQSGDHWLLDMDGYENRKCFINIK